MARSIGCQLDPACRLTAYRLFSRLLHELYVFEKPATFTNDTYLLIT